MNVQEIKNAVNAGYPVRWANDSCHVIKDNHGRYLIVCQTNQSAIGLTHQDGETLNGNESEFYISHRYGFQQAEHIRRVLAYCWEKELLDYQENEESREGHIFNDLVGIENFLYDENTEPREYLHKI